MKKIFLLVLLSIVITGCGTSSTGSNEGQSGSQSGIVAGEVVPSLTEKSPLVFEYMLKNQTEEALTLEFTSSQRFDYSVHTKDGKEIYLFSSLASFLQATGEEVLEQGKELSYEFDLSQIGLEKGEYVVKAWMIPKDGKNYQISKEFVVQ